MEKKLDTRIEEYLSLQELNAVLGKINIQSSLPPKNDRLPAVEKGCLYQIHNPIKDEDAEELEKENTEGTKDKDVEEDSLSRSIVHTASQAEFVTSRQKTNPINRKTVEKIILALLMCVISATIILPFFLSFGDSIETWSSSVSYDYDESCDDRTNVTAVSCMLAIAILK